MQCNVGARSCSHFCGGKAVSITYSEYVFVALFSGVQRGVWGWKSSITYSEYVFVALFSGVPRGVWGWKSSSITYSEYVFVALSSGVPRGVWGGSNPPEIPRPSKIVPNSTRL